MFSHGKIKGKKMYEISVLKTLNFRQGKINEVMKKMSLVSALNLPNKAPQAAVEEWKHEADGSSPRAEAWD